MAIRIDKITKTSGILSFVAGYADTSTFVGADRLFSAHITGNFVVFAYDIVTGQMFSSWIKLISFPVFIFSIGFSSLIIGKSDVYKRGAERLLIIECSLLLLAGGMAYFYRHLSMNSSLMVIITMLIVFALGMQNAYGRFFVKEVFAPTTIMTGNVTQLIIDITNYLKPIGQKRQDLSPRIVKGAYVIFPFLFGCITGGVITNSIGLTSIVLPGILIFVAGKIRY